MPVGNYPWWDGQVYVGILDPKITRSLARRMLVNAIDTESPRHFQFTSLFRYDDIPTLDLLVHPRLQAQPRGPAVPVNQNVVRLKKG